MSLYVIDNVGFLCRQSKFGGYLSKFVPCNLRYRILMLAHIPPMPGHPGERQIYSTMRRFYYWPHLSIDVQAYGVTCRKCLAERVTEYMSHYDMKMFTVAGPLEFDTIYILRRLPTSTKKNQQFILVIYDRFSKVTQAVPLRKVTTLTCTRAFFNG